MLTAIDIETECAVEGCDKGHDCRKKYKHALDFNRNRITLIGIYNVDTAVTFSTVGAFSEWLSKHDQLTFVAHNGKFDFKVLKAHGLDLMDRWVADTELMASVSTSKIPDTWLDQYETLRAEKNKELPSGYEHRKAGKHSLKSLAPYFLGVDMFWENPADHNNAEYCLKDCEYTYKLHSLFSATMAETEYDFYKKKLLPWSKMLLDSEFFGIRIDEKRLDEHIAAATIEQKELSAALVKEWSPAFSKYHQLQLIELENKYVTMWEAAWFKVKDKNAQKQTDLTERYAKLKEKAALKIEPFNIDSNAQLMWLLRDHLGYNMADFNGKDSTGKEVLERLAGEGKEDVKLLLRYRKVNKLITSFFPTYKNLMFKGRIHCFFNPTGTRTGRLSSSLPNLQQVPSHLHDIFIADEGCTLITKDFSAIEPRAIAYFTECPILYEVLSEGMDFHGLNTKIFFNLTCHPNEVKKLYPRERKVGKEVGLAIFYGAGAKRLKQSAQKHGFYWSEQECRQKVLQFKHTYLSVWQTKEAIDSRLKSREAISNLLGRPIAIEKIEDVHMKGFNKLIQSSASDLLLNSAYKIGNSNWNCRPLLFVHDELVVQVLKWEADDVEKIMDKAMTNYSLTTPQGSVSILTEGSINERWTK